MTQTIDPARLWQSHLDMARIGATPEGGSDRPALSAPEAEARALLLHWATPLNLTLERDAIGNLFLHRPGTDPTRAAIAFGSHLDTVPTGGRFDGVFGVMAGLEVLRTLQHTPTPAPLELVVWTNEEGSRFPPAMMGSRVHAGTLALEAALATTDDEDITVAEALVDHAQLGLTRPAPRHWAAWLEPHIEQGPILEATQTPIGIVTATVQARYFQITLTGAPSHVGPTTMDRRQDSLAAAAEIILVTERLGQDAEPHGRTSAAWIQNHPNVRSAVPAQTRLHLDVRHQDPAQAATMEQALRTAIAEITTRRRIHVHIDPYATFGPATFDPTLNTLLRTLAAARGLATQDLIAAAGHDSVLIAPLCPSAMLFVPSQAGITHNPAEYTAPEHLAQGAQLLLDAVTHLAM